MRVQLALAAALGLSLAPACSRDDGPVQITVTKNGFEPPTVHARAGKPLTLVVTRTTDETCATEFVLPEENLNVPLPLGEKTVIVFTPKRPGKLRYACAMKMFFGDIEVK